jgi:hypothetical protein
VRAVVLAVAALGAATPASSARGLELGLADQPNGAAEMRAVAPFGFRYQYLAGDVRGESGWRNWNPNGRFVTLYVKESRRAGIAPVFPYYTLQHSEPGLGSAEDEAIERNLSDRGFVDAWLADIELALRRTAGRRATLHLEPDLWGHLQQRHGDTAPRQARRLARRVVAIRNSVAPRVRLAYHVSIWGTGTDIVLQDTPLRQVGRLARRAARFYRSLGARFDLVFGEMDDRDAGFNQHVNGDGGRSWWTQGDYARHVRFFARFTRAARRPVVIWQVPLGNSRLDDSWGRYRDNKVETLLGDPKRVWLKRYARAGVIAFLFGAGAEGATTDETDGGLFDRLARRYYRRGRVELP